MKVETMLWAGVTGYFVAITAIYAGVGGSAAGVVILAIAAGFGGLVAGWSWRYGRRHAPRPSDIGSADATDATGSMGEFPAASLRPLGLAAGFSIAVLGVALGSWMIAIGLALVGSQVGLLVRDRDG